MKNIPSSELIKRRHFIVRSCALGTSLCFGCSSYFSLINAQVTQEKKTYRDKIEMNSGMSYEQVFNFSFRNLLIPQLLEVANQLGRDKLIDILKVATYKVCSKNEIMDRFYSTIPEEFWKNAMEINILEDTPDLKIWKTTKCLWAKTFRDAGAGDIGYALICYGDVADYKSRNLAFERNSCLMMGDDCCHFKITTIK